MGFMPIFLVRGRENMLWLGLIFSKRVKNNAVIMYKISDGKGNVIEYINVINDDFSNLWRIFKNRIGMPTQIKRKGTGFTCRANKQIYKIDPF